MSPRIKKLAGNLALACTSALVCLLVIEIALRFMGFGNVEVYAADPSTFWRLKPDQQCYTKIGRKPVRVNSHGTRGPEIPLAKPAGTIRILSLGDSTAFGWGLAEEETYAARLETLLREKTKRPVEVINAGVNAWSYAQMLAYLRRDGIKFSPDYVLLGGANLWTQFSENSSPEFVRSMMNRVRLKNFLRLFALYHYVVEVQLESVYQKYRTRFVPIDPKTDQMFKEQQQQDPNKAFYDAVTGICQTALTNSAKPILFFAPIQDRISDTNQPSLVVKQRVHREMNVPLIDVTEAIRPVVNETYLEADPVHLNAKGNEIVAQALAEYFLKENLL